jgi:hypothetical protein
MNAGGGEQGVVIRLVDGHDALHGAGLLFLVFDIPAQTDDLSPVFDKKVALHLYIAGWIVVGATLARRANNLGFRRGRLSPGPAATYKHGTTGGTMGKVGQFVLALIGVVPFFLDQSGIFPST